MIKTIIFKMFYYQLATDKGHSIQPYTVMIEFFHHQVTIELGIWVHKDKHAPMGVYSVL